MTALAPASLPLAPSIFVGLTVYRSKNAGRLVRELFRRAHNPQQVFVGVLEHEPPESLHGEARSCLDALHQASRDAERERGDEGKEPLPMQNVRYHAMPFASALGASVARQELIGTLYRGETFIFLLHDHSSVTQHWDRTLLTSLAFAHRRGAHVISQVPPRSPADHELMARHALVPTTYPRFIGFGSVAPPQEHAANHVALAACGLPRFKAHFVAQRDHPVLPFQAGIASYMCLFGTAEVVLRTCDFWRFGLPFLAPDAADLLLSVELWVQHLRVMVPSQTVVIHHGRAHGDHFEAQLDADPAPTAAWQHLTHSIVLQVLSGRLEHAAGTAPDARIPYLDHLRAKAQLPVQAFFEWLGVDPWKRQAYGRATLGVLAHEEDERDSERPSDTPSALQVKYGSRQALQRLKYQCSAGD